MSVRLNHEAFGTYETTNERKGTSYSTHLQFRTELYCQLLQYSTAVQQIQLQMSLLGQRTFGSDLPHLHYWVRMPIRSSCKWCLYKLQMDRLQGLVKVGARAKSSILGCSFCNAALCQEGLCWGYFHGVC
jgi:hypothetical protein